MNDDYICKFENFKDRFLIEEKEEWQKWASEIPSLNFDSKWDVKIIPPLMGAFARFHVSYKDKEISVYLDCLERLGIINIDNYGKKVIPYWEIYTEDIEEENSTFKYKMSDTSGLMSRIKEILGE